MIATSGLGEQPQTHRPAEVDTPELKAKLERLQLGLVLGTLGPGDDIGLVLQMA